MRTSVPMSLLTIGLVRADTDGIVVKGPFSSFMALDNQLCGRRYPDDARDEYEVVAVYDTNTDRWYATDGCPLIMWSVGSVDDALDCGCPEEQAAARFIKNEFIPETAEAGKRG